LIVLYIVMLQCGGEGEEQATRPVQGNTMPRKQRPKVRRAKPAVGVWIQLHRIDPSSKCRFIIPRTHALDSQHDRKLMAQVCRTARRPASSQVSHYCLGSDGVGKAQARPRRNTPLYVCELTLDMSRACRGESSFESFVLNSQGKARQNQKGH
jgi:hypothetical protein